MTTPEMYAAALEADQANRDFMSEWINGPHPLSHPSVQALRSYRGAAERVHDDLINSQISQIVVKEMWDADEPVHQDYPHWPGMLIGCPACEQQMQEEAEAEYDTREWSSGTDDLEDARFEAEQRDMREASLRLPDPHDPEQCAATRDAGAYPCQRCYPDGN